MPEIIALLVCLEPILWRRLLRQLGHAVWALLCIPNRATMLGLSRWTEKGGSYRTLQRLYQAPIEWLQVHWLLVTQRLLRPTGRYLLAGDEVVVSKAGKATYGVGRFYASIPQRAIPSVSFMALSLIDVEARHAYPLHMAQLLRPKSEEKVVSDSPKRPRGRPKGSKNHAKRDPLLSPALQLLQTMLGTLQARMALLGVHHVLLDGQFGNFPAQWTVRQAGLHLISKLRHDAALYLPYTGTKPSRGPTARYGDKLIPQQLPAQYRVETRLEGDYQIQTYQFRAYLKECPDLLNIVVVVKTQLKTGKRGHVILFSTDLTLSACQIVDYYSLRFQIEFNFRDAKQYWGLQDFMNVSSQAVTNAVNLAFFMVNLAQVLLKPYRQHDVLFSVLDLKAQCRAQRYLAETIKMLPQPPKPDLIARIWQRLTRFGGIRTRHFYDPAA